MIESIERLITKFMTLPPSNRASSHIPVVGTHKPLDMGHETQNCCK